LASREKYRTVILTALPVEYTAVRKHLGSEIRERVHNSGTIYEVGHFSATKADWEICLVEVGAGNAASAFEAERAIATFDPIIVLFVGIAGGLKDVSIGDIVFSTKVYGYESGKDADEFLQRPDVGESTYALEQRARAEARKLDWISRLARLSPNLSPKVFVGPMAAGEKVVASTRSPTFYFLRRYYSDALAVEMEGRGFLRVIRANKQVEAGVIRGISDLLDDKSSVELLGSQEIAAAHAAAFAFQILDQFDIATAHYLEKATEAEEQIKYVVVISGQFSEINIAFAKAAFEFLKTKANDPQMVLEQVKTGSLILLIQGSFAGFQRLNVSMLIGDLIVGGYPVRSVTLGWHLRLSDNSSISKEGNAARKHRYKIAELEKEDLKTLIPKLVAFAEYLTRRHPVVSGSEDSAEDIVHETVYKYLTDDRVQPPDMSLFDFLSHRLRQVFQASRARVRRQAGRLGPPIDLFSESDFIVDLSDQPEESYTKKELVTLARSMLAENSIELRVFDLVMQGDSSTKLIAGKLATTVRKVDAARKRIRGLLGRLLDDRLTMVRHAPFD
jgi:nucleoside phosphorylase/DNA-directed RNA polymerase specialized sigma24 family protein